MNEPSSARATVAVGGLRDDVRGQGVAVGVGVVGQHAGGNIDRQHAVLGDSITVADGHGGRVGGNRDVDRGRVRVGRSVVGRVGERVGAGVTRGGRVDERAVVARTTVPWAGCATTSAVKGSPSASVSLASTPVAAVVVSTPFLATE